MASFLKYFAFFFVCQHAGKWLGRQPWFIEWVNSLPEKLDRMGQVADSVGPIVALLASLLVVPVTMALVRGIGGRR